MKYIIKDKEFTYEVDFDNVEEEYFPSPKESIEAFLLLLQNVHPKEAIADCLAKGLDAMDYSMKGREARKVLR